MINHEKLYNPRRTTHQLEEWLLFCIATAGKNGLTTARALERFLGPWRRSMRWMHGYRHGPFDVVQRIAGWWSADRRYEPGKLAAELRWAGLGCHNQRARSFLVAATSGFDLRTAKAIELEQIPGVGMKTARLFILYSRSDQRVVPIDRHWIRWLQQNPKIEQQVKKICGHVFLKPPTGVLYPDLEEALLWVIDHVIGLPPHEADQWVWTQLRKKSAAS